MVYTPQIKEETAVKIKRNLKNQIAKVKAGEERKDRLDRSVAHIVVSCHILTVTDLGRALTPCLRKIVWWRRKKR